MGSKATYRVAWLPGDGIGREVTNEALRVLEQAGIRYGFQLEVEEHRAGGSAIDADGTPLPTTTLDACKASDGVLLGAVGGPQWDDRTGDQRPEAGLLRLRKELGVYANLRPVSVPDALLDASPLRRSIVAGTDMMIVRELTGGIYFGEPKGRLSNGEEEAFNTMRYAAHEVERIARVAFEWARRRRGRVTSVDKANVLDVSGLWRDVVSRVHEASFSDVELDHLYVDNAAMQLVRRPSDFDVIVTGNLFGDILSDLAATLPGSLGLLPSASIGGRVGLFEPVHGSAPDIAGKGVANPIAAVLSVAMMLDHWQEGEAAATVRDGVEAALSSGMRTADIADDLDSAVGTEDVGRRIAEHVSAEDKVPS